MCASVVVGFVLPYQAKRGMVEVGSGWFGWSGAQPDG